MKFPVITTAFFAGIMLASATAGHAQTAAAAGSDAAENTFKIDGDTIFYRDQGTGTAMLLIHGFPLDGTLFRYQASAFSSQYRVITPDLPGFGQSVTSTSKQTEEHYAREMLALMKHLGIQQAIIGGHSMGGQVTLEMYRLQPGAFSGMILFDTNPAPASIVEMAEWPAYGRQAEKYGSASIAPPVVGVMVTGKSIAEKPALARIVTTIVSAAMPKGVAGGGNALATRPNYQNLLGKISIPTLVIVGQDDPVYPAPISQALAAAIPHATLNVIPSAAHASMLQRPQPVNDAMTAWAKSLPQ